MAIDSAFPALITFLPESKTLSSTEVSSILELGGKIFFSYQNFPLTLALSAHHPPPLLTVVRKQTFTSERIKATLEFYLVSPKRSITSTCTWLDYSVQFIIFKTDAKLHNQSLSHFFLNKLSTKKRLDFMYVISLRLLFLTHSG